MRLSSQEGIASVDPGLEDADFVGIQTAVLLDHEGGSNYATGSGGLNSFAPRGHPRRALEIRRSSVPAENSARPERSSPRDLGMCWGFVGWELGTGVGRRTQAMG